MPHSARESSTTRPASAPSHPMTTPSQSSYASSSLHRDCSAGIAPRSSARSSKSRCGSRTFARGPAGEPPFAATAGSRVRRSGACPGRGARPVGAFAYPGSSPPSTSRGPCASPRAQSRRCVTSPSARSARASAGRRRLRLLRRHRQLAHHLRRGVELVLDVRPDLRGDDPGALHSCRRRHVQLGDGVARRRESASAAWSLASVARSLERRVAFLAIHASITTMTPAIARTTVPGARAPPARPRPPAEPPR